MSFQWKKFFKKFFGTKIEKKSQTKESFFKISKKFLGGRGSKILPVIVFLAEKTEPNYDTAHI